MAKSPDAFRTIGEVAAWLDVPPHNLRFWESKFSQIRPIKRAGGRRYYRPEDMQLLGGIRALLHERGLTIKGVQRMFGEEGREAVMAYAPTLPGDLPQEADVTVLPFLARMPGAEAAREDDAGEDVARTGAEAAGEVGAGARDGLAGEARVDADADADTARIDAAPGDLQASAEPGASPPASRDFPGGAKAAMPSGDERPPERAAVPAPELDAAPPSMPADAATPGAEREPGEAPGPAMAARDAAETARAEARSDADAGGEVGLDGAAAGVAEADSPDAASPAPPHSAEASGPVAPAGTHRPGEPMLVAPPTEAAVAVAPEHRPNGADGTRDGSDPAAGLAPLRPLRLHRPTMRANLGEIVPLHARLEALRARMDG